MRVFDAPSIRNVALVGHSGAGKTQLASALLFDAGVVNRLGKVDEGTTVTDYDDEEIARKHTLGSSLAWLEWNKTKVNLVDTPGMANFLSDTRGALRVTDAALVVVDAVAGVQVQTEAVWRLADEIALPRLDRGQPVRSRARQPRALAGVAAQHVRPDGGADHHPDRAGTGLPRRHRPGLDEGVHVQDGWQRRDDGRGDSRRSRPRKHKRRAMRWSS